MKENITNEAKSQTSIVLLKNVSRKYHIKLATLKKWISLDMYVGAQKKRLQKRGRKKKLNPKALNALLRWINLENEE